MISCKTCLTIVLFTIFAAFAEEASFEQTGHESYNSSRLKLYLMTGLGIKMGGSELPDALLMPSQSLYYDDAGNLTEVKDHYLNYGQGIKLEVGADIAVAKNLWAEFGFGYTGGLLKVNFENYPLLGDNWQKEYKKHCFGLKALVKPCFRFLDLLDMYAGIGAGLLFTHLTITSSYQNDVSDGNIKTKPTLAFLGLLGVDYPLNDIISLKGEIAFEQMSFTVKEILPAGNSVILHFDRNSTASNEYQPINIPGSNLAIRLGICFSLL